MNHWVTLTYDRSYFRSHTLQGNFEIRVEQVQRKVNNKHQTIYYVYRKSPTHDWKRDGVYLNLFRAQRRMRKLMKLRWK